MASPSATAYPTVQFLDGGLGTSLQDKYGVVFDASTPLWASHLLVSDPATLLSCQRDFAAAGIDILLTATYQVSIEGFMRTKASDFPNGIPRDAIAPFLCTALDVAEKAVVVEGRTRNNASIALSLGPYGACMIPGQEYSGKYDTAHDSEEALYHWHLDRLRLFLEADNGLFKRVQYIAFETLPRLDEIRAVRKAIFTIMNEQGLTSTVPFWISCVFPNDDQSLPDGASIKQAVTAAIASMEDGAIPWGIGMNCTKIDKLPKLIDRFGEAMKEIVATTGQVQQIPILVLYPDGTNGEVYNTLTQQWEKIESPDQGNMGNLSPWEKRLANTVREAYENGYFKSFLVGGCCKASHEAIQKLHRQLRDSHGS